MMWVYRIILIVSLIAFGGWDVVLPMLCVALTVAPFILFATYDIEQSRRRTQRQ